MIRPFREVPSDFLLPRIEPSLRDIERLLERQQKAEALEPLPNPHHEPQVPDAERESAMPAAVLIALIEHDGPPGVVLTRRHLQIRFGGHISFPGGRLDPGETAIEAALRESHEEIALQPSEVRVIGRLGDYFTHHGYHIVPVVGAISAHAQLAPREGEVDEIIEVPLGHFMRPESYRLRQRSSEPYRANFSVQFEEHHIGGPTLSILMNLYRMLVEAGVH